MPIEPISRVTKDITPGDADLRDGLQSGAPLLQPQVQA